MSYPPGPPQPEQPGYGPPHPDPAPGYVPVLPTNNLATAALITGITTLVLSWCCGLGVFGVVAVVLGLKGRAEVRRSQGTQTGEGLAIAGIITGGVAVLIGLLVIALILLVVVTDSSVYTSTGDA